MSELCQQPPRAGCPSDLVLDRWVAGAGEPSTGEHLDACERCRARLAAFEETHRAAAPVVARTLARATERATRRRPLTRWLLGGGLAVAASAAALLVTVSRPEPAGIRPKGSSIRFVVQRDGEVFPGRSGDPFYPGDALRFLVSAAGRTQFLLVGIEESGRVNAYFPYGGGESVELAPGADVPLPGSLVLDNTSGTEYFLGTFSEEVVTVAQIELAVSAIEGELSLSTLRQLPLPGSHHWVVIRKE